MRKRDTTHDPARRSWVPSANAPGCEYPIQNLPLGVFSREGEAPRIGTAIGDRVLDLTAVADCLPGESAGLVRSPTLNPLMAAGPEVATRLRQALSAMLAEGADTGLEGCLIPMDAVRMHLPAEVGDFTDFMISRDHSARLGALKNPASPLPPAFFDIPIGYHSRASSLRVSGTPVTRPNGQRRDADGRVTFGPERKQDFELELAIWIAGENRLGAPVPMSRAPERIFGYGLLNDWSSREIQFLEMPPLGPFLGKSLSTTVSPWVVTADAMAPFAAPLAPRPEGDGPVPAHLDSAANRAGGSLSLALEVLLLTPAMRRGGHAPSRVTATEFAHMYWTPAQLVAHHASNGCSLLPGDLFGSGTLSGPTEDSRACLAEFAITGGVELPGGERRVYLEDGDEVIFRARAHAEGAVPIGFGECRAVIEKAPRWPD